MRAGSCELDEVAEGKRDYLSVVKDFWTEFDPVYTEAKGAAVRANAEDQRRGLR